MRAPSFDLRVSQRRWANQFPVGFSREQILADGYAESLCDYADDRLSPSQLHSWIVWRLIVDGALEHDAAETVATEAIEHQHRIARAHRRHGPGRRQRDSLLGQHAAV